jgi:hypothetical protein
VANTLKFPCNGVVGFIDGLDRPDRPHDDKESSNCTPDNTARDHIWRVARFRTAFREINHKSKGESIERADDHRAPPSCTCRATSTPPNVAAQRICHLYGSLGSKKIVAPSRPPSTAPIIITAGKFITPASAIIALDNSQNTRRHVLTRPS